jgi:predicted alpha/beta-fold hydrolase
MTDFRPLRFLSNPHLQTLLGNLLRGPAFRHPTLERQVLLPDGDRLVLHDSVPPRWQAGAPIALLVHGLGGSHSSGYMHRVARLLLRRGVRAVRMDLRGSGRGAALARRTYNGGCSEDVRAAALEVLDWSPSSPMLLLGFSLGGNIVLKFAGEAAAQPLPGLRRVAAVAPPIDLVHSARLISAPRNRLYELYFLRNLVRQVRLQQRSFPDQPALRFPPRLTLRRFDDLYTAPRGGFRDALDYYQRASSLPLIGNITVPTLILAARDDPFVPVEPFESLPRLAHLEVCLANHGGHLGFLGRDGAGGIRWAEQRVVDWATRLKA